MHAHSKFRLQIALGGLMAAAMMPHAAQAASYSVTDLGALSGGAHSSHSQDINNSNQVVGYSQTSDFYTHAFSYANGKMTDLGTLPGGFSSSAAAVNDSGQIVGDADTQNGIDHAFLYDSLGFHDLGSLAGPRGTSQATAINSTGQIAGSSQVTGGAQHAFLYTSGKMTDLGTLGSFTTYRATAVSKYGPVGTMSDSSGETHAFYYNGHLNEIVAPSGSKSIEPTGINDSDQVCGFYYDGGYEPHAFLYDPVHGLQDIGTPNDFGNKALAINNNGQILCEYVSGTYLYTIAMQTYTHIATPPNYSNTTTAFNNAGIVVGYSFSTNSMRLLPLAFIGSQIIGALPGGSDSVGSFLNASGSVVGRSRTDGIVFHATLWDSRNGLQNLGTLTSLSGDNDPSISAASGINAAGTIVGYSSDAANEYTHAFSQQSGGAMTDLGRLFGGYGDSYATAINDHNQIIGYGKTSTGASHVFYLNPGQSMVDIGVLPGGANTSTNSGCINAIGQIVGSGDVAGGFQHAFLYYGQFTDLGLLPGGTDSQANGINNLGQIIGKASVSGGAEHSFLYQNGHMSDLGLLPGGAYSQAFGINDLSQVVGCAEAADHSLHGYQWSGAFGMRDLNSLLPANGTVFQFGQSINTRGQITGYGVNAAGDTHAFLLTPTHFDFSGDGADDILFQSQSTGKLAAWAMNDTTVTQYGSPFSFDISDYKVVGSADFNGDGHPDILFQSQNTGKLVLWLMNNTTVLNYGSPFTGNINDYTVVGVADMNGDGHPDILFQSQSTGKLVRWLMNGTAVAHYGSPFTGSISGYKVVGLADFNGDGCPDILFQSTSDGSLLRWLMQDTAVLQYGLSFTGSISGYNVVGTGDFNGDGHPDILFQSTRDGSLLRWLMNDTTVLQAGTSFTGSIRDYSVVGVH